MILEYTFEQMFYGLELLNEISQGHYNVLKYKGIESEMRIMQIGDWKVFYTPTDHFKIRVGERIENFPSILQYKCASTYFKNIKHFNEGYGRINGLMFLFGFKHKVIPLKKCVMLPYEIQYDTNEKVAEIVAKTLVVDYPTKGEKVTRANIKYEDIMAASFDISITGNEISNNILMDDNVIVNDKAYRQRYKMKDLINQSTYIPCKMNYSNIHPLTEQDKQPGGIVTRFKKD